MHVDAVTAHKYLSKVLPSGQSAQGGASETGCGTDYGCSNNCEFSYCEYISLVSFFT